jgi:hypothetical protein
MKAGGGQKQDRVAGAWRGDRASVLLATALACVPLPASVSASPALKPTTHAHTAGSSARANTTPASENAAATHAYLIATLSFEEVELADLPKSVAATEETAARISGECPGVLTGAPPAEREPGVGGVVGLEPKTQPGARAMGERTRQSRQREDLQLELSLSLAAARMQPNREAVGALLTALTPLQWSNPKITPLLHLTLTNAQEELDISVPAVCEDMKTWVASGYKTIGRGNTAVGGRYAATVEPRPRSLGCVNVTITEPSGPRLGALLEILSGEGTGRCLSRSHIRPEQSVHCNSGLLTVEADLLPAARSVRLLLSDGHTIDSPAIRVPSRLGGPAGLYYQVVRGPSPIPVSLTELDAQGRTLAVLQLSAVTECTKNPVKYFPGGIVTLAHESLPQGPSFIIRAERYRKLGAVHFELKLKVSNEEELYGPGGGRFMPASIEEEAVVGADTSLRDRRAFQPKASSGCQPQPYVIVYGLLKAPRDTVLARVAGTLVPLRRVAIPARLHAGSALAYGAFSPIPTELLIRDASGKTVARQDLAQAARSETETCEGEAE